MWPGVRQSHRGELHQLAWYGEDGGLDSESEDRYSIIYTQIVLLA